MNWITNGIILLVTAIAMESVAWATHKYVMHGFLWVLHEDHHKTTGRKLQKNDLFAVFFAAVSFLLLLFGVQNGWGALTALGLGVMLYGIGYFLFHEVMFHRRIKGFAFRPERGYLHRIINAHRYHHGVQTKEGRGPFSFLYASPAYAKR